MPWHKRFMPILVFIFLLVIFLTCLMVSYFFLHLIVASFLLILTISLCVFVCCMMYLLGDKYGSRSGAFGLKKAGSFFLGSVSMASAISMLGLVGFLLFSSDEDVVFVCFIALLVSIGIGIYNGQRAPKISRFTIHDPALTGENTIVHLSDIHLNGLQSLEWTRNLVNTVNNISPDIIVFTGDLYDISPSLIQDHLDILSHLSAPHGKFAVSGNHDFFGGYAAYKNVLSRLGFRLMDNASFIVNGIQLVGFPDSLGKHYRVPRQSLSALVSQSSPPTIILDHRPDHARKHLSNGILLQLSGHTHGGQLPPWTFLVWLRYRFSKGFYIWKGAHIFTSSGTGAWGPPMRLFSHSEIGVFHLSCR
jgi:predicted MPP superfamily phosphohydrolase